MFGMTFGPTAPTVCWHTCHSCGQHWEHRPSGRCQLLRHALCPRCCYGPERLVGRNAIKTRGYREHPTPEGDR